MELLLRISYTIGVYMLTEIYTPGFLTTSQEYSKDTATLGRIDLKKLLSLRESLHVSPKLLGSLFNLKR